MYYRGFKNREFNLRLPPLRQFTSPSPGMYVRGLSDCFQSNFTRSETYTPRVHSARLQMLSSKGFELAVSCQVVDLVNFCYHIQIENV